MALLFFVSCTIEKKSLIIYNNIDEKNSKESVSVSYPIDENDHFSIEFIHSVNKSPVVEYYKIDKKGNLYVYKTIYYNYGAGVPTDIEGDETISYGEDGSMIIDNINRKINNLTYYLSDISDHVLKINDSDPISLWGIFGQNETIHIDIR